ncbi:TNF receptor-associated factor 4 [Labeo rohita]|uniref:TNF receptor-associated factor 4 n=2 Tax=Labeonini TaxID=2743697 RepID=A0ABQ8LZY3_LABRO|nr:TNF receptor-associated factor 4 [Labeo rohita]
MDVAAVTSGVKALSIWSPNRLGTVHVIEGVFKCPEDQLPLDYAKPSCVRQDGTVGRVYLGVPENLSMKMNVCVCGWEGEAGGGRRLHMGLHGWRRAASAVLSLRCRSIYPDPELEQQILALPIRCIHKPLLDLRLQCDSLSQPLLRQADAQRPARAPAARLSQTQGQESVYCENKCGARMMRRLLSQHTMTECPKRTQPCKYCGKEFVYDTIQNHQYHCPRFPVQCPNQCGTPNIAREDLANHVKESCGSALVLCPFKEAGCKHRCPKMAIGRHLEESTKSHLTMMCNLVGRQRQEIMELRREMEELSVSHDGVLIWKLTDYSRKLQEAKLRNNHEFFSPPFYTHRYGYKLQVSAFLNGNGSGEGSHLSIYIRVLPGEYDNLLEWPFSYKVTFSILDQSDPSLSKPQHITETFNPDPNWKNFQKPCSSRNSLDESTLGFGYPKFISHEEIKKRNYIRDNSIFLKASIEIPQKIMA